MTLCKKGGGFRKNSNFECIIKSDILLGEGGWFSTHHLLIFQLILLHFESFFNIIACFFSIFDMNSNFIINCWSYSCVNRKG